jgi:hypothetical protein
VEKYTGVEFWLTGSYTEYHNGNGRGFLTTRNIPITAVTRVATEPLVVMEIANTSTSHQRVYVNVNSTAIQLVRVTSGTTTTVNNTFAAFPTLSGMATEIDALGNGWNATVTSGYESYLASDLRQIQHAAANSYDGPAELEMYVEELPISRIDENPGTIWGCFPCGIQNIELKYTAGYADVDSLPEDLEQAVVALTGSFFEISQSGSTANTKSEKIGDYAISFFENTGSLGGTDTLQSMSLDAYMLLNAYRRLPL